MRTITKGPWKIEQQGWYTSDGRFQPTSPNVDIVPAWEGPGSRIRIASGLSRDDAEFIVKLANAEFDKLP